MCAAISFPVVQHHIKHSILYISCRNSCEILQQQVDKLAALSGKVNSVKLVMQSNVDAALQNCVKLDSLEAQAGELHLSAFT